MRSMRGVFLGLMLASSAQAGAPESSLRPQARGQEAIHDMAERVEVSPSAEAADLVTQSSSASPLTLTLTPLLATRSAPPEPRPKRRPIAMERALTDRLSEALAEADIPGFIPDDAALAIARTFAARSPLAVGASLRPLNRPGAMVERVMAQQRESQRGAVCGDIAIQGEMIGYVPGRINGCGIAEAVKVRSVSGIALSQNATMDCTTARALKSWVERGLKPSIGSRGGGVARIRVAAHYACRSRNNQPGAKISEHGKGRAIDIAGVTLRDGSFVSVLKGWSTRRDGTALRKMHASACGPFGTVLGPEADAFHRDHFHFDTARYRSGSYCR